MSDSEDEVVKPFGGFSGTNQTRPQKRSFSPNSDDGDLVVRTVDDSESPPPDRPLIRQGLAFSVDTFTSLTNTSNEINTYQSSAPAAPGSKKFLPGQGQVASKSKKNKTKKEKGKAKAEYVANTTRFRLKDWKPPNAQSGTDDSPSSAGTAPTLGAFQTSLPEREGADSPAPTSQSLSSENGNGQRTTPSDFSEVGTAATDASVSHKSAIHSGPNSQATKPPAGPSNPRNTSINYPSSASDTQMLSTSGNPLPVITAVPSPLSSNPYMAVVGPNSLGLNTHYRRDYDKQQNLTITETISQSMSPSRQHTQSAPLPHHSKDQQDNGLDARMHSPSPASPHSISSPPVTQSTSLSPTTTQHPSPQVSSSTTIHPSSASSHTSELNHQFRHATFSSSPLQARPQFRSPPSDHRPQFRPSQFDEQSSQSSKSRSPPNDMPRSPPMDIDQPSPETRYPMEGQSRALAGPQPQHYRVPQTEMHPSYHTQALPQDPRAMQVKSEDNRSMRRHVQYKTSRMVTLLITDFRSGTEDHQLAEVMVPLRQVDPDAMEAGFWANAEDIVDRLQSSPSRIEASGKAYTMRGKWKQFFLRVVDGRNEVSPSNLLITGERTLDVGVVNIAPSELQPQQYSPDTSRKRQRSPSQGGRERRPFSMS